MSYLCVHVDCESTTYLFLLPHYDFISIFIPEFNIKSYITIPFLHLCQSAVLRAFPFLHFAHKYGKEGEIRNKIYMSIFL